VLVSLRARLIAGLLALAAVGLLVLAGVTYAEQRRFLFDRVDQQARSAPFAVAVALSGGGFGPRADQGGAGRGFPRDVQRPPPGGPGTQPPAGTFGERRAPDGTVVGEPVVLVYSDETVDAHPDLPAQVPVGRLFTVDGTHGDGTRYRVYALRDSAGDTVVAAVPLREVDRTLHQLLWVMALVVVGVLAILGAMAWIVVRIGLLPLDRMGHTAGAIAGGDLSHRVEAVDQRTEVGRLGIALNAMLDRLEGAFAERAASEERLRRFLADASHELRTPLASIRGYAELFRIGAAREPRDTEKAMRRIEEEAQRMGVLVEDLLMLARLDEVHDAAREQVDLAALAGDAVDDARATAPDRDIDLDVDGAVTVSGEPDRLRQVLGNLLRNALVHTPPGTPIEVRLTGEPDGAHLVVRDHGSGLPTDQPEHLFERFWRAEGGRERGRGGAGLGLAIVAAIVDGHGGTVSARNASGGGAIFEVVLPVAQVRARRKGPVATPGE
jgi:two-component system, OmpR family, sensor kinase